MIEEGWATFFPIYPSLPRNDDLNKAIAAAEFAWFNKKGMWEEYSDKVLLGYEYRMCIRLGTTESTQQEVSQAFQRLCLDLCNLQIVGKYDFCEVPQSYRLWIWENDLQKARVDLGLS
jgi:hypothetical protein